MTRDVRERVAEYLVRHPDAGVAEVLGALGVDLSQRDAVADVVGDDVPEVGEDTSTSSGDRVQRSSERSRADRDEDPSWGAWGDADFATPEPDVYPPALLEREQWMGHVAKKPFAPWGDRNHPEADHDEDARWKWGLTENYVDGEAVAMGEADPRLDGRAFLQQPDDPFAYVDGDDVRDPETGDVHPGFVAMLEHLGLTYADVSQSGSGAHAIYRGALPDGVKQASWDLDDEPFGANDELPSIEIYAGKRVCVMTGDHVAGTPTDVREWDDDALEGLLEAHDLLPQGRERRGPGADGDGQPLARSDCDLDEHEPEATTSDETTTDIRDLFAAIDRLDARRVAGRTIVASWNDDASTSDGHRAFAPTWGPGANGTANIVDRERWVDTGGNGYGGPTAMAAIDAGLVDEDIQGAPRGEDWFEAVEHLRDLGFEIPQLVDDGDSDLEGTEPTVATPLARFDALDHDEARRYARKRDDWPTTREARQRLRDRVVETIREREQTVVDAPTALGKSYTVATEPWLDRADTTGEAPVVMFHETREARDQAREASLDANVRTTRLLGRTEACACAAGEHDPARDGGSDPDVVVTVEGEPASDWLRRVCDERGLPLSVAHKMLAERCDQEHTQLPCEGPVDVGADEAGGRCRSVAQWDDVPRDGEGEVRYDVIHATHQFAHVPSLRNGTNMVFDERPDFAESLPHDRVREMVAAFLDDAGAPVADFERFVARARRDRDDRTPNEHAEHAYVSEVLDHQPDREWYVDAPGAHTLAPAVTRAIWYALDDADADTNGRFSATVTHDPPRLDEDANDDAGWNREYVSVVVDEQHNLRTLRVTPDTGNARSVVGLDAHPTVELWQRNVHPDIRPEAVLGLTERARWRRYERGLVVAQVGDATRPLTSGEYFDEDGTRAFCAALRDQFGDRWRTAITAASVEGRTAELMDDVGVDDPDTLHYGEEKSRNDFGAEDVGAVLGCIDPGDDYVLDLLAEAGLDAEPETTESGDRAHGRGFVGPDADAAAALLASVRENHVAQAAGRYARNADDQEDRAVVFVRTDATPPGFVDVEVPGVQWVATETQRDIVDALRARGYATARDIADDADVSKRHAIDTLRRLADAGVVDRREGVGDWGADVYRALSGEADAVVDLGAADREESRMGDHSTWAFTIVSATVADPPASNAHRNAHRAATTSNGGDRARNTSPGGPPDG